MDLIRGYENLDELLQAQAHVWNHTFRFVSSLSLKCAVQLEIGDAIFSHGQPMTISELALALAIHPSKVHCLYRLMRILVHSGFFVEQQTGQSEEEKGYALTLASRLLLKDKPFSARPWVLAALDPIFLEPWQFVSNWIKNDDDSAVFNTTHGRALWEYAEHYPRLNHLFNDAMASDGLLAASLVLQKCKGVFERLKSLVDVGGGFGTLSNVLAKAFPQMDCTVFDLPHVVAGLEGSENFKYVAGNMCEKIPPGDAILLKWILHDWSDEDCVKILKRCKEAIGSEDNGGKVIVIDIVMGNQEVDDEQSIETKYFFDMQMMVSLNGKQRNEQEWRKLFVDAGFTHNIYRILGIRSLIELFPVTTPTRVFPVTTAGTPEKCRGASLGHTKAD